MSTVASKDGTLIAYEKQGSGPALVLVDGALCWRGFGPMGKLAALLAGQFTVYTYDRRGRGASGDAATYDRSREVEDLAALLREAGGRAFVAGLSSGAALALEAVASGLPIAKVVAFEPPYMPDTVTRHAGADHPGKLRALLAEDRRGDMVRYFMRDMVGAPGFVVFMMSAVPWVWSKLKAVAHTLPYDATIMDGFRVPVARLGEIHTPTLVVNGGKTDPNLQASAKAVAAAVPGAGHRVLDGQTHNVAPKALAPVLTSFFMA